MVCFLASLALAQGETEITPQDLKEKGEIVAMDWCVVGGDRFLCVVVISQNESFIAAGKIVQEGGEPQFEVVYILKRKDGEMVIIWTSEGKKEEQEKGIPSPENQGLSV